MKNIILLILVLSNISIWCFVLQEQQRFGSTTAAVFQGGTGQTTFTSSRLLYGNGSNALSTAATTSASCSGSVSCTVHTVIGSSPITISGTGISNYDAFTHLSEYNTVTSATTTPLWGQGGFYASSTSQFTHLNLNQINGSPFTIATTTATSTLFAIDRTGAIITGGGIPSLGCGIGTCSLDGHSNDQVGTINTSGVVTAITLTFSTPKSYTPHCVVSVSSTGVNTGVTSQSASAITISFSASIGTGFVNYYCVQ